MKNISEYLYSGFSGSFFDEHYVTNKSHDGNNADYSLYYGLCSTLSIRLEKALILIIHKLVIGKYNEKHID